MGEDALEFNIFHANTESISVELRLCRLHLLKITFLLLQLEQSVSNQSNLFEVIEVICYIDYTVYSKYCITFMLSLL